MQNDLISRSKLAASINREDVIIVGGKRYIRADAVSAKISMVPTIDAVEVVRCRECFKRGQHDLCPMNVRVYMLDEAANLDCTEDDGFCHKGAKMDGGAE